MGENTLCTVTSNVWTNPRKRPGIIVSLVRESIHVWVSKAAPAKCSQHISINFAIVLFCRSWKDVILHGTISRLGHGRAAVAVEFVLNM